MTLHLLFLVMVLQIPITSNLFTSTNARLEWTDGANNTFASTAYQQWRKSVVKSSIALSNNETIILNQNAPNPFKDKTEITYTIPEAVKNAVILFYDHSGKVIQKFEISHRGAGSLTVYGEDLTSGVYTYSLIIDGENHQTKRMVKQ